MQRKGKREKPRTASGSACFSSAPIRTHQINLQKSLIGSEYQPIRGRRQPFRVRGNDRAFDAQLAVNTGKPPTG
jgi:hypothetical protein